MKDNKISQAGELSDGPLQFHTNPPHRILVVEDEVLIRQLNSQALTRAGYEADSVEDGAAAWDALNNESYDLVITDNNMPRMTGVQLLKQLRFARMELPVIMATGKLPEQEFARSSWLRPAATLRKPYTIGELLRTVKKVLRESGSSGHHPRE